MKRIQLLCVAMSILTAGISFAQTQFPAETAVALSKPGPNSAAPNYTIFTIPNTGMGNATGFTAGVTVNFSPRNVNGIGLNETDRLLYAAAYSDNGTPENLADDVHLYRIGADGVYQNLGILPITGQGANVLGTNLEYINFSAGTVYDDKYIYTVIALKNNFASISKVVATLFGGALNLNADDIDIYVAEIDNISSLTSVPAVPSRYYRMDISNLRVKEAINAFLQDFNDNFNSGGATFEDKLLSATRTNGGFQDIDINPADEALYTYINYPDPTPEHSNVDVVGFPVKATLNSLGTEYVATPIGTITNEEPSQEIAGLAFDKTGAHLYGLFTSGEYGEIDLITGAVTILGISNIPTEPYNPGGAGIQNHLRGDLARPFEEIVTPVEFGTIQAVITDGGLIVNWQTLSEVNNHHFDIEVSVDGKHFTKVSTVLSKAQLVSNTPLDYTHTIDRSALPLGVLSVSVLGLMSLAGLGRRVSKWGVAMMIALTGMGLYACSKSDVVNTGTDKTIYVRIAQVDIDGTTTYSKVIKAVKS